MHENEKETISPLIYSMLMAESRCWQLWREGVQVQETFQKVSVCKEIIKTHYAYTNCLFPLWLYFNRCCLGQTCRDLSSLFWFNEAFHHMAASDLRQICEEKTPRLHINVYSQRCNGLPGVCRKTNGRTNRYSIHMQRQTVERTGYNFFFRKHKQPNILGYNLFICKDKHSNI